MQTHTATLHGTLESRYGSPLALGLLLAETLARCEPDQPRPRLLALRRSAQPLAHFTASEGVETMSDVHASVLEAMRGGLGNSRDSPNNTQPNTHTADHNASHRTPDTPNGHASASGGHAAGHAPSPSGHEGSWEQRVLVVYWDAESSTACLLDPSAGGARTRLECSQELLQRLAVTDPRWLGSGEEGTRSGTATLTDGDDGSDGDFSGWSVPASSLLDSRGSMALMLGQLAELYHLAGTPSAIQLHHRCAALLEQLKQ